MHKLHKFYRSLQREFRLQKKRWDNWLKKHLEQWIQEGCSHEFRPVLIANQPGRICKLCAKTESLSLESFYAHFGERGIAAIKPHGNTRND